MRLLAMIAIATSCILAPIQASAQLGPKQQPQAGGVLTRVTPEQVASALTQAGYRSQVVTRNNQKFVTSSIHGFNITTAFFDCNNQGCGNLQFVTWFNDKVNTDFVNAWNAQYRFAKATVDRDGELQFSMDVWLGGGVTLDNIKGYASILEYMLGELTKFRP